MHHITSHHSSRCTSHVLHITSNRTSPTTSQHTTPHRITSHRAACHIISPSWRLTCFLDRFNILFGTCSHVMHASFFLHATHRRASHRFTFLFFMYITCAPHHIKHHITDHITSHHITSHYITSHRAADHITSASEFPAALQVNTAMESGSASFQSLLHFGFCCI